jgi:low affinity Fe/Cu permease
MAHRKKAPVLERFSSAVSHWAGSAAAFGIAVGTVLVWLVTGSLFDYSDSWQLVINTGTTIVTFLMVFLIQRSQNKESLAVQLKLNELVAAMKGASNRLVDIEDLDERELQTLRAYYVRLAHMAATEKAITRSHSIDEAAARHEWKKRPA